jgi:hypothetical protein
MVTLLLAVPALAEEHVPLFGVTAVIGVGAPTGLLGGEVEVRPTPWTAFAIGAGTNAQSLQLAGTARVGWFGPFFRIWGGAGLSGGAYKPFDLNFCPGCDSYDSLDPKPGYWRNDLAVWSNFEFGVGVANPSGLYTRFTLGYAAYLNPDHAQCVLPEAGSKCAKANPADGVPFVSVGVGYEL